MTEEEYIAQGDAAWKAQDWKLCHDSYVQALRINPESQAGSREEGHGNENNQFLQQGHA